MATINVVDVSYHQGTINWEKVTAAGYHAILRCGYGDDLTSQDDKQWKRNADECTRLGIPLVYIFIHMLRRLHRQSQRQDMC